MITKLRVILFYLFLFLLYLLNLWGLFPGENNTMILLYITPFVLFSTYIRSKEQIRIPYDLGLLMILFIITTLLSAIYAVHIQTAFEYFLYIVSIFLIFIYVYNNANQIQKYVVPFIVVSSLLSLLYSGLLLTEHPIFSNIVPTHDDQLIYRVVDLTHYPQGVFVFLLLIISFVYMRHRRTTASIVSVFLLSILLWLSYLRSAYLGMLVVIMVDYLTNNAVFKSIRNYKISLLVALVTVLFLLIPFADQTEIPVISQLRTVVIRDETAFHYKDFDNGRIGFITTALQAIRERPLTGYGGGNFYYASLYYSKNIDYVVSTSHNLFIDIAAEHGIVSFLTFALIIFVVTRKVIRQMRRKRVINNVIGSVFIGLFVLFQFNYYHLMAFLFVFFFICGALLYEEKASIHGSILLKSVSFLVALFGVGIFVSSYVNARGNSSLALRLYPINDKGYRYQIADLYRNQKFNQMEILINKYAYLYRDVPFDMSFLGRFNSSIGNNSKALQYYLSALNRAPRDTGYVVKVFELMSLVRSEEDARSYVEKHLREYTILYPEMQFEDRDWFSAWCHANNLDCYYEKSVRNQ